jgi:peptidyl-prolyl cis-trans isomerase D
MLDMIRKYRALFSIIFVLAAVSLVMSDFGRTITGMNLGMGSGIIARVDGEDIKTTEFLRDLNNQLRRVEDMISEQSGSQKPEEIDTMRKIFRMQVNPDSVLSRLIDQKFREATAEANGIEVSPSKVRDTLAEVEVFQEGGKFDPLLYKKVLLANGLRPTDYEKQVAGELKVQNLQQSLIMGLATQSELEFSEEKALQQKKIFEVAAISPKSLPDIKAADPVTIKNFREDMNNRIHFDNYYNEHIEEFRKSEAVKARHILFADNEAGKKQAEEVLKDLKADKITFEEAAKKYSQDKSNANEGGALGFFERGVMDPAFETAAYAIVNPNDFSPVVKSSFGYHIIQLEQKRAASERPLDKVMEEIAPTVWLEVEKKKQLQAQLDVWSKKPTGPATADLKAYKAEWKELPAWSPMDDRLGPYSGMASQVSDLMKLGPQKTFLTKPIEKGGNWLLVRWKKDEASDAAADKEADAAGQRKAQEAMSFYFENRFKDLEKKKKIVKSEENLARIRSSFKEQ